MPNVDYQRELNGRTAVVTGASTGIGRAIAVELARAGADVVIHARSKRDEAEATASEVRAQDREATVVLGDLSQSDELEAFFAAAWKWRDGVDIWVNNAGVDVLTGPLAAASFEEKLQALWQVDLLATMRLSRLFGAQVNRREKNLPAALVNVGWDQAAWGMGGDSGEMFAAIKGAIMAFSASLAQSLAPRVRVNCVAPGWIRTAWGASASTKWDERARGESLLDRWGAPADVAAAVRFLVSPAASFINGQVLPVNGGFRFSSARPGA